MKIFNNTESTIKVLSTFIKPKEEQLVSFFKPVETITITHSDGQLISSRKLPTDVDLHVHNDHLKVDDVKMELFELPSKDQGKRIVLIGVLVCLFLFIIFMIYRYFG